MYWKIMTLVFIGTFLENCRSDLLKSKTSNNGSLVEDPSKLNLVLITRTLDNGLKSNCGGGVVELPGNRLAAVTAAHCLVGVDGESVKKDGKDYIGQWHNTTRLAEVKYFNRSGELKVTKALSIKVHDKFLDRSLPFAQKIKNDIGYIVLPENTDIGIVSKLADPNESVSIKPGDVLNFAGRGMVNGINLEYRTPASGSSNSPIMPVHAGTVVVADASDAISSIATITDAITPAMDGELTAGPGDSGSPVFFNDLIYAVVSSTAQRVKISNEVVLPQFYIQKIKICLRV